MQTIRPYINEITKTSTISHRQNLHSIKNGKTMDPVTICGHWFSFKNFNTSVAHHQK